MYLENSHEEIVTRIYFVYKNYFSMAAASLIILNSYYILLTHQHARISAIQKKLC